MDLRPGHGATNSSRSIALPVVSLCLNVAPPFHLGAAAHCAATDQGHTRADLAVLCNTTELGCAAFQGSAMFACG